VVEINIEYQGELRCRAVHAPSSAVLLTDAPVDNHGRGESFSPTDLVATGLGTCMATVMSIQARKLGFDLTGTRVQVNKQMTAQLPRRIARLTVQVTLPAAASASVAGAREAFERYAHECPVRLSLLGAIEVPVHFDWQSV